MEEEVGGHEETPVPQHPLIHDRHPEDVEPVGQDPSRPLRVVQTIKQGKKLQSVNDVRRVE